MPPGWPCLLGATTDSEISKRLRDALRWSRSPLDRHSAVCCGSSRILDRRGTDGWLTPSIRPAHNAPRWLLGRKGYMVLASSSRRDRRQARNPAQARRCRRRHGVDRTQIPPHRHRCVNRRKPTVRCQTGFVPVPHVPGGHSYGRAARPRQTEAGGTPASLCVEMAGRAARV